MNYKIIAKTIHRNSANLVHLYSTKRGRGVILPWVRHVFGDATAVLFCKSDAVRWSFFREDDVINWVFDYMVEHSPIVLYDFHTYLTKNETEFERVCGNCVPVSDVPEENGTYIGVTDQNATPSPVNTLNTDQGATPAPVTTPNTDQLKPPAPVTTAPASVVPTTVVAHVNENASLPVRVSTLTSDQLISRYGETVFTMRIKGKSGVSCVKFLFEIYGIKAQKCTPTCTFKHSLDYDFGVPIGFIFREYGNYTYYYRKMHGNKPVVFQFATSDIDKFASGLTEIVPIGTHMELRGALKNLFLD